MFKDLTCEATAVNEVGTLPTKHTELFVLFDDQPTDY